jgi:hypothetical protein
MAAANTVGSGHFFVTVFAEEHPAKNKLDSCSLSRDTAPVPSNKSLHPDS